MRLFLSIIALAFVAIAAAPFVRAGEPQPATPAASVHRDCKSTFGEYRVHCLQGQAQFEA